MAWNGRQWALTAAVAALALLTACQADGEAAPSTAHHAAVAATPIGPAGTSSALCLTCHDQPGVIVRAGWGRQRELDAVTAGDYYLSAHGDLPCVRCHEAQASLPHEKFAANGLPLAPIGDSSAVCQSCHPGAFERFLDSVHGTNVRLGDGRAPGCTDCHTTHYVKPVRSWTASARAESCVQCHDGAQASFAGSLTHKEPSPGRLPVDFFAARFFGVLVVAVVGIGILHVELDLLRWLRNRISQTKWEGKAR